jgi:hypothetical protein
MTSLKKQLDVTNTATNLQEVILNAIDRALGGRPVSIRGTFGAALRAQERIGWRSLLQGYWAIEWQEAYCRTYVPPEDEAPEDASKRHIQMGRWQSRLIRTVWTSMIALWKLRNDDRHGRDKETKEASRHEVLTNELQQFYMTRAEYPEAVQNLLRPTLAEHATETAAQIEDWLQAFSMTFKVMHIRPNG